MQPKVNFGPEINFHTNLKNYSFLGRLKKFVTDTLSTTIKRRWIKSIYRTRKCARPRALSIPTRHVSEWQGTNTISAYNYSYGNQKHRGNVHLKDGFKYIFTKAERARPRAHQ